jgi:hypothetical protein
VEFVVTADVLVLNLIFRADAVLMHAMQAGQGIVTAAKDGLRSTVAYSPQTQCTIISFAIISLIKVSSRTRSPDVHFIDPSTFMD